MFRTNFYASRTRRGRLALGGLKQGDNSNRTTLAKSRPLVATLRLTPNFEILSKTKRDMNSQNPSQTLQTSTKLLPKSQPKSFKMTVWMGLGGSWAANLVPVWLPKPTKIPSWRRLGTSCGCLAAPWVRLGASWSLLEPSRAVSWGVFGASWGDLGGVLGCLRASWGALARFGGVLGPIFEAK